MNLQIDPMQTISYISIGDQTVYFECEGDFYLSVGESHFINPKSLSFKNQEKFQIHSHHFVKMHETHTNNNFLNFTH